jgi:hypothetical protein
VVCLAPRAPGDSVRPRRLSGVIERPLNFPVRSHFRKLRRREEFGNGKASVSPRDARGDCLDSLSGVFDGCIRVRVRLAAAAIEVGGARPSTSFVAAAPCPLRARREPASVVASGARLMWELCRLT